MSFEIPSVLFRNFFGVDGGLGKYGGSSRDGVIERDGKRRRAPKKVMQVRSREAVARGMSWTFLVGKPRRREVKLGKR